MESPLSQFATSLESPKLRQITLKVQEVGGINLGQGVCQLPVPPLVIESAKAALEEGVNRYTNPRGLESLREALAQKLVAHNGFSSVDPDREVLITCGSTGAFEGVCASLLNPGDEVILFQPFYPYHQKTLHKYGARIRLVDLSGPEWAFDRDELAAAFSPRTKFVLINTPSNPTGKVFSRDELRFIGSLCQQHDVLAVTDEIYEYMVYDGRSHVSPATVEELAGRTLTMGGYSKTFSITGWRIGYLVAPPHLSDAMTRVLDLTYVCAPAPLQEGVARSISALGTDFYTELGRKYLRKRDLFASALESAGLQVRSPQGSYYMIADFGARYGDLSSLQFVDMMIRKARVGGVPSDDFVMSPESAKWVRFCYAVEDDVLENAARMMKELSK